MTAPDELRAELDRLSAFRLITACAALSAEPPSKPANAVRYGLHSLAQRWLALHNEIKTHTRHLKQIAQETAPQLTARIGIGFDCAAELLIAAGDN